MPGIKKLLTKIENYIYTYIMISPRVIRMINGLLFFLPYYQHYQMLGTFLKKREKQIGNWVTKLYPKRNTGNSLETAKDRAQIELIRFQALSIAVFRIRVPFIHPDLTNIEIPIRILIRTRILQITKYIHNFFKVLSDCLKVAIHDWASRFFCIHNKLITWSFRLSWQFWA